MGIFSKTKKDGELVLVFDIGSSSVGGALCFIQESGIPKIIKTIREPIVLQETLNIDQFLSSTIRSLEVVADQIYKAGLGAPKKCFCVLSSPWHISQTRLIKLEKNTPFTFTAKLANSLIKKEIALFEEEYLAKHGDTDSPVRSIEFKNIKIMLNGYETFKPLDQKAQDLEMTIFISICEENVLKKIEDTIGRHFHFKNIKFSSFTLASFAVVRDVYSHDEDFLLIDVSGELTEISMAKKNVLCESISFPLGCNFFVRQLASFLHSSLAEAKSLLSLLKDGHAAEPVAVELDSVVKKLQMEWLKKFQDSLANLSNDISIPSTIYLAVDKDLATFICKTIETEQFNQYTLTASKFKVIFLGVEVFHGMATFEGNVTHDTFLIIDSIFINQFLNSPTVIGKV